MLASKQAVSMSGCASVLPMPPPLPEPEGSLAPHRTRSEI